MLIWEAGGAPPAGPGSVVSVFTAIRFQSVTGFVAVTTGAADVGMAATRARMETKASRARSRPNRRGPSMGSTPLAGRPSTSNVGRPLILGGAGLEEMPPRYALALWPSPAPGSLLRWYGKGNMHLGLVGRNARRGRSGASVLSDCVSSDSVPGRCRPGTAAAGGRPPGRPWSGRGTSYDPAQTLQPACT